MILCREPIALEYTSAFVNMMTHKVKQNTDCFPVEIDMASLSITEDPESGRAKCSAFKIHK